MDGLIGILFFFGIIFFAIRMIDRVDQIRDEQRELAKAVARIEAKLESSSSAESMPSDSRAV